MLGNDGADGDDDSYDDDDDDDDDDSYEDAHREIIAFIISFQSFYKKKTFTVMFKYRLSQIHLTLNK